MNKKIKICYVIVRCRKTGPMNQTLNIIKNLDTEKFEASFVTLFSEYENDSMIDQYLAICSKHECLQLTTLTSLVVGKRRLRKVLRCWKPDIVQGLGMPPYRISLGYKKTRHLVTLRNYAYEDYPSHYNKLIGPILAFLDINLIKKLSKRGEVFVTCSKSLTNIYREKEKINIPYICNGVDSQKYSLKNEQNVQALREKLNLPLDKILFIYTGPLIDRKDQESAINGVLSADRIDDVALVLCGEGANYNSLREKFKCNKKIIFTGNVNNINEYLQASDIYISTSKSEGMPNGVLEAMATGLAILVSDIPQHKELFEYDQQIGRCYKLGDMKDLKANIDIILEGNYRELGRNGYDVVNNNLTSSIMSEKYQKLYVQMLEEVK